MADQKISALTSASTPLAGTEVLPIVQSGATVKVATNDLTVRNIRANATTGILQVTGPAAASTRVVTVPDANFTAARTDAAQTFTGNQTITTGNIVQGTAARGFNFTANTPAAGMSSQLLNWYEEGLFTPTITFNSASVGITYNSAGTRGSYVRIGRQVTVTGIVTLTNKGSSTGDAAIAALPFTMAAGTEVRSVASVFIGTGITFTGTYAGIGINGTNVITLQTVPITGIATALTDVNFSNTSSIWFTMTYSV